MNRAAIIIPAAGLLVAAAGFTGITFALSGTESTTVLDSTSKAVTVDGTPGLAANVVAGRTESKYHPLPWVGTEISKVTCPAPLPARVGARITCSGTSRGSAVAIDVTTTATTTSTITWKFDR